MRTRRRFCAREHFAHDQLGKPGVCRDRLDLDPNELVESIPTRPLRVLHQHANLLSDPVESALEHRFVETLPIAKIIGNHPRTHGGARGDFAQPAGLEALLDRKLGCRIQEALANLSGMTAGLIFGSGPARTPGGKARS
jgi:hypothetical protein